MNNRQYSKFIIEDWSIDSNRVIFRYSFDETVHFEEILEWPLGTELSKSQAFIEAANAYHILAGTSYYKAYFAAQIEVKNISLDKFKANFFNTFYKQGLGEYLYTNNLNPDELASFDSSTDDDFGDGVSSLNGHKPLVMIGGGKDSLTTVNLLESAGVDFETFRVNPTDWVSDQLEIIGAPARTIKRTIDSELIKANKQGALNGHVPVTAIVSMAAVLQAIVSKNSAVVVSAEASASIPNTEYQGMEINHQFSKSLEAEKLISQYINQYIADDLEYFSLIRPWSELKVAEYFAKNVLAKYQKKWSSSNLNFKRGANSEEATWDDSSPKSLAIFGMLSAFMDREELLTELGFNGYRLENEDTWHELLGVKGIKPFECVADSDEMRQALMMAQSSNNWPEMTDFEIPEPIFADYQKNREHNIPEEFVSVLPETI
jgi:hypothetical protein